MSVSKQEFGPGMRVVIGLVTGAFVAAVLSAYALLMWLWNDKDLGRLDVTFGEVLLIYFAWGPCVGAIVGLIFPLTRRTLGAVLTGGGIMASFYAIVSYGQSASAVMYVLLLILGLVIGGVAGKIVFGRIWSERTS